MQPIYIPVPYENWKDLEDQMKKFKETTHTTTPGPFYHKSIRLKVSDGLVVEFHAPMVMGEEEKERDLSYSPEAFY